MTGQYPVAYDPDDPWSPGKGIAVWHSKATKYILGNTIYDADGGIYHVRHRDPTIIANNIISNISADSQHVLIKDSEVAEVSEVYNNLFDETARITWGGWGSLRYDGIANFQSATGKGQNCVETNPLFVDAVSNNFNLQSTSPAIDAGIESEVYQTFYDLYGIDIKKDIEERVRPQGNGWDIGAYESPYSTSNECSGTDTSCGIYPSCANCNNSDGCSGTTYRDYYCISNSSGCGYTEDDCSDCSCSCGGYNTVESTSNGNCSDGIDNDCDGSIDSNDSGCWECAPEETQSCDTGLQGICSTGTQTCQVNGTWGSCIQDNTAVSEVCNDSLDNDCDGSTDCSDTDCSSDPSCQTSSEIPSDYIAYWKFDGNVLDETGNNNGTIYGDPQYVEGVQGQALDFDGDGDYVKTENNFISDEGVNSFSVSFWVKAQDRPVSINFLRHYLTSDKWVFYFRYRSDDWYELNFYVKTLEGSAYHYKPTPALSDYNWHHVVGVYNGSNVYLYLDGLVSSKTSPNLTGNTMSINTSLAVGTGFNGQVDNVMIYNRALSADEIKFQYYNQNEADNELTWDSEESFSVPTYMRIK